MCAATMITEDVRKNDKQSNRNGERWEKWERMFPFRKNIKFPAYTIFYSAAYFMHFFLPRSLVRIQFFLSFFAIE